MHNSSKAPGKKGSLIKNIVRRISPEPKETQNTLTKEYLDKYLYDPHPKQGYALNILFSSEDPNKYDVINYLASRKVDQSKAIEFALQNKNSTQAEDLFLHLNFNPNFSLIEAVKMQSLILMQYFVEEKKANINLNYFGSNLLEFSTDQEITNYLLEKGAKPSKTNLERASQDGDTENIAALINEVKIEKGEHPLMLAAQNGHVEAVKHLLENGAKTKIQGWQTLNLYVDVALQVNQISEVWEKINNTNINFQDLIKHVKNTLDPIFRTTISSKYIQYNDISKEQIRELFPKLLEQLKHDLQVFTEIRDLLESYSPKTTIGTKTTNIVDDSYISDFKIDTQDHQPTKKLGEVPAASGMFRPFSLEALSELDTDQTSLSGGIKDILDFEFIAPSE